MEDSCILNNDTWAEEKQAVLELVRDIQGQIHSGPQGRLGRAAAAAARLLA